MVYRIAHEVMITVFESLKAACSQGKLVFKSFEAPQHIIHIYMQIIIKRTVHLNKGNDH